VCFVWDFSIFLSCDSLTAGNMFSKSRCHFVYERDGLKWDVPNPLPVRTSPLIILVGRMGISTAPCVSSRNSIAGEHVIRIEFRTIKSERFGLLLKTVTNNSIF